jgi:dihydrofolate reductase
MRRLVVSTFVSLDGVMEAPGGEPDYPHTGWAGDLLGPDEIRNKFVEVLEADSLLIGRVTYESFAGAWPLRDGPFADKMNSMPKHVVSTTMRDPEWTNCKVISEHVMASIQRLKDGEGGPILVPGSRTLAHTLFAHHLVDELRLMIFPAILGSGRRLLPDSPDKLDLQVTESVVFPSGILGVTYRPR